MQTTTLLRQLPLLGLVVIGGAAIAQSIDNDGRDFPYVGYLEEDGFAVTGTRDIEVTLSGQQTGGSACDTQSFSDVAVATGRFQLELADVPDACLVGGELWLTLAVGPAGGTLTSLSTGTGGGRVRVASVPFAAANPAGSSLLVGTEGQLTFEDPVTGVPLNVAGDATEGGLTVRPAGTVSSGQALFRVMSSGVERLRVEHDGEATVGEDLRVNGNAYVEGQLHITDIDSDATGADGCMRIGSVQQCWGAFPGDGWLAVTFRKPFANSEYSLTCTANPSSDFVRYCVASTTNASTARVSTTDVSGGVTGVGGSYFAIGAAGDAW